MYVLHIVFFKIAMVTIVLQTSIHVVTISFGTNIAAKQQSFTNQSFLGALNEGIGKNIDVFFM